MSENQKLLLQYLREAECTQSTVVHIHFELWDERATIEMLEFCHDNPNATEDELLNMSEKISAKYKKTIDVEDIKLTLYNAWRWAHDLLGYFDKKIKKKFNRKKYLTKINKFWKCKTATTCSEINEWFEKADIFNKPIKRIITTNDIKYLDRSRFIDIYNNDQDSDEKILISRDKFDISYIRKDIEVSVSVSNKGAIVFVFEDDSTFEILSSDFGVYHVSQNELKDVADNPPKINLNIEKMFKDVVGNKIVDFKVNQYKDYDWELNYVNRYIARKEPIQSVEFKLSNGKTLYVNYAFWLTGEKGIEMMRFDEYLDCIYDIDQIMKK